MDLPYPRGRNRSICFRGSSTVLAGSRNFCDENTADIFSAEELARCLFSLLVHLNGGMCTGVRVTGPLQELEKGWWVTVPCYSNCKAPKQPLLPKLHLPSHGLSTCKAANACLASRGAWCNSACAAQAEAGVRPPRGASDLITPVLCRAAHCQTLA